MWTPSACSQVETGGDVDAGVFPHVRVWRTTPVGSDERIEEIVQKAGSDRLWKPDGTPASVWALNQVRESCLLDLSRVVVVSLLRALESKNSLL